MKTIRSKLSEALPPAHRTVYEQAAAQIRRMYSRRVLLWFLITAAVAAVLALATRHSITSPPLFIPSLGILGCFAALWIMMSVTEQTCSTQRPAAPPPTGEQLAADDVCRKEQETLRNERSVMKVGGFFLFPLIPLILLIAALHAYRIKERPGTAGYASALYASDLSRRINAVSFFFLPLLLLCIVFSPLEQYNGLGKLASMNSTARSILTAAAAYETDLNEAGIRPEWKTVIISPDDTAEKGSIQFGVEKYLFNDPSSTASWYAVVIDENGELREAYCSCSPLTEADLVPPDPTVQRRLASSPFHVREIIGYWNLKTGAA